jgi:6-phosphogluconolactonase (cycloisomerase 2 family)
MMVQKKKKKIEKENLYIPIPRQVMFSIDGNFLLTAARRSNGILFWDIRHTFQPLGCFLRAAHSNQPIYFDLSPDGRHIATGATTSETLIYDITNATTPVATIKASEGRKSSAM